MKKVLSVFFLILAVVIIFGMVGYTLVSAWNAWNGEMSFKQLTFDSFADYYFSVHAGALTIAGLAAILSLCLSIYLYINQ